MLIPGSTQESATQVQLMTPVSTLTPSVRTLRNTVPKSQGSHINAESEDTDITAKPKQLTVKPLTAEQEMRTVQPSTTTVRTTPVAIPLVTGKHCSNSVCTTPVEWTLVTGNRRQHRRQPTDRTNKARLTTANERQSRHDNQK